MWRSQGQKVKGCDLISNGRLTYGTRWWILIFQNQRKKPFSNIIVALKPIVGKVVHESAQLEKSCNGLLENIKSWKSPFIVEVSKQI
jgi:hypothetical protein